MEVVAATPNGGGMSPFHNHDVCEWSCVDSLTGVLERARRETDHWTANTNNSRHKYGKVVDCRARSGVDGNLKQEARRQLEVFQSQIPGGRLQVIKTQSVSSSRWTNRLPQESHDLNAFKDLHLSLNPLDVSSQKSKASLGRSNVGKRPPTRQLHHQRNRNAPTTTTSKNHDDTSSSSSITNLHRVPRLCHQIHDSAAKSYIQTSPPSSVELHDKQQSSASVAAVTDHDTNHQLKKNEKNSKLTSRTPSTSSDDSHLVQNQYSLTSNDKEKSTKSIEDLEDLEKLRDWRRTSKLRSFQHTKQNKIVTAVKPTDLPENNGSVRKIREDIEKGRRLNAALRSSNVNLEALDQILLSITTPCLDERKLPTLDKDRRMTERQLSTKSKKNSFVTVDSIKEVRDRLRRTTSPVIDDRTCMNKEAIEHNDEDSFVTEICKMSPITSKVKSYTYGMENAFAKKSTSGTGSLESRLKHLNSHSIAKNEDWYNRRKSYGFEKMHNPHNDNIAKTKTADSSTDSGICRSSEIPSHTPEESSKPNEQYIGDGDEPLFTSSFGRNSYNLERENCKINDIETTTINIPIVSQNAWKLFGKEFIGEGDELKRHSIAVDESKYILKNAEPKFRRTSLAVNASDLHLLDNDAESFLQNRRQKKVEFCKTEVHFTAESGKVNIVETDDKPPSTNNFRKKRRNSGLMLNFEYGRNNGLPMFNFGDDIPINDEGKAEDFGSNKEDILENGVAGLVTVNSKLHEDIEENHRENFEFDLPKSILKNKAAKPKRYILGDDENYLSKNLNDVEVSSANNPWEVRLNPIRSEAATPMWQSTVTVRNTLFSDGKSRDLNSADVCVMRNDGQMTEIQKLLRNLRPVSRTTENSSDFMNGIRIVSPNDPDARPAAWSSSASVSDRIKHVENQQKWMENRGYSTKVNIGNGEATVIEDHPDRSVYNKHPTWPRIDETSQDLDRMQHVADTKTKRTATGENIVRLETQEHRNHVRQNKNDVNVATSPPSRAAAPHKSFSSCPIENGSKFITNKLSSPALVGKSTLENQTLCDTVEGLVNRSSSSSVRCFAKHDSLERQAKKSSEKILPQKIRGRSPGKEVLRQPKKAEMAYFGLPVSPQTAKKHFKRNSLSEKPDLLQFIENKPETSSNVHIEESLYENVDSVRQKQTATVVATRGKCEFDSSILEELTRAADQILQAVNGYTEEDSEHKKNHNSRKPLDTISETKSWRQQDFKTTNTRPLPNKSNSTKTTKIKPTSSNSSIESVHTDRKKSSKSSERKLSASTLSFESKKVSRKIANDSNATTTTTRANVKARRLQRASSREALLQSHGSSSEDLPVVIEVPLRKPRLIRKNKNANSTTTDNNSLEKKVKSSGSTSNKREDLSVKSKSNTRVPATDLPEIRHKTAVSTIRSTAERSVAREKTEKFKTVESKRKPLQKSDSHGVSSSAAARNEKSKSSSGRGRENSIQSQRASTANVKRCIRQEGLR